MWPRKRQIASTPALMPAALTLLSITVAASLLPHFSYLPIWFTPLLVLCIALRLAIAHGRLKPLANWLRLSLTVLVAFLLYLHYGTLLGRAAGSGLLACMLSLKLLETYRYRDAFFTTILVFFVVITQFFRSQEVLIALYMTLVVVLTTASLIMLRSQRYQRLSLEPLRTAGGLLLKAVPLMLVMFFLFPRISVPFWGLPDKERIRSGLGEEMSPGSFTDLIIDDSPVFRVHFLDPVPAQDQLYWRGPTLWRYDGHSWRNDANPPPVDAAHEPRAKGPHIRYEVTLLPTERHYLFALDLPIQRPSDARLSVDYELRVARPIMSTRQYRVTSSTRYLATPRLSAAERNLALQLPTGRNPLTLAQAKRWRRQFPDARSYVHHVMNNFRQQKFFYTLSPALLGRNAMDEFLFDTREGFCEHYASAFVVLMRAAGIPARVVTGYQGGLFNPIGKYLVVRNSNAHAWAEAWIKNLGWVRYDPTSMVSPERVSLGINEAMGGNITWTAAGWLGQVHLAWDSVENLWSEWVVSFNDARQRTLLSGLAPDGLFARWHALLLAIMLVLVGALVMWLSLREYSHGDDPAFAAYQRFCRRLTQLGSQKQAHESTQEFASRAARSHPAWAMQIRRITHRYEQVRYANQMAGLDRLQHEIATFRRQCRPAHPLQLWLAKIPGMPQPRVTP